MLDFQKEYEALKRWYGFAGESGRYAIDLVYINEENGQPGGWSFYVAQYPLPLDLEGTLPVGSYPGSHQAVPFASASQAIEVFDKFAQSDLGKQILAVAAGAASGQCDDPNCDCKQLSDVEDGLDIVS